MPLAPGAPRTYGRIVRRFPQLLVYVVVAAQLLLAVPAMAAAQLGSAPNHQVPCDEMSMPAAGDGPCPCCPDGADSMTDCLVTCTLAATAAPSVSISHVVSTNTPPAVETFHCFESASDPPLDPPPIA